MGIMRVAYYAHNVNPCMQMRMIRIQLRGGGAGGSGGLIIWFNTPQIYLVENTGLGESLTSLWVRVVFFFNL